MPADFGGKTAIVTGAARGVGRAIASKLFERGANVMLSDSDEAKLEKARDAFPTESERIASFSSDVTQKLGVKNLIAATMDAFKAIDVLVTTAPDFERGDPMTLPVEAIDRAISDNVRSAFLLSQAVAAKMIARAQAEEAESANGAIVHVSSLSGRLSSPEVAAHAICCAAVDQLTRSFAATLAKEGIRVNGVAPGGVLTDALKGALSENGALRPSLLASTPLGRIGEAGEAAEAALFLASDAASFITGQIMIVDGGRSVLDPVAAGNV